MSITLHNVYPWGRTLGEYTGMFSLTPGELAGARMLSAADGPASFNAELTKQRRGVRGGVISVDPLYAFTAGEIRDRVLATAEQLVVQAARNADRFTWQHVATPEDLRRLRLRAMDTFLADYPSGLEEGRYLPQSLPSLDFPDDSFELALCSHFLFLYSAEFDAAFHVACLHELLRIACEARVFPLLDLAGRPSAHISEVTRALRHQGFAVTIDHVAYEFQRGGNQMLRVRRGGGAPSLGCSL